MNKWSLILNLLIPANYIWISELIFTDEEKGRFFPYIITLLIFTLHVATIFAYSKLRKKGIKWSFLNFILLMIALGANIFIFEQFLFEK